MRKIREVLRLRYEVGLCSGTRSVFGDRLPGKPKPYGPRNRCVCFIFGHEVPVAEFPRLP